MIKYCLPAAVMLLFLAACREKTVKFNMLVAVKKADSAVIMYYHQAGDPRFYNYVKQTNPTPLPLIARDVNQPVIDPKDSCTTEGKIYFYGQNGAVETVYFSRKPECMTISFIRTGEKYFTRMSGESKALLDSLEKNVVVLPGRAE